jgi:hypothetical protein
MTIGDFDRSEGKRLDGASYGRPGRFLAALGGEGAEEMKPFPG